MKTTDNLFISLVPDFKEGVGHILPYHLMIREILDKTKYNHYVLYYDKKTYKYKNWKNVLKMGRLNAYSNKFYFLLIFDFFLFTSSIFKSLKSLDSSKNKVFFIESFGIIEICAFLLSIFFIKNSKIIIFFRSYPYGLKKYIYKILFILIKIFTSNSLYLCSDSESLSNALKIYFKLKIVTFPVPIKYNFSNSNLKSEPKKLIWWPGPYREEKGAATIRKIASELFLYPKFTLCVTEDFKGIKYNKNIIYTKKNLSSKEYKNMFLRSEVILLPYDKLRYQFSTSNIFIESIIASKFTFVTKDTWMADELIRYGLEDFVLEINNFSLEGIIKIINNKILIKKLNKMSLLYKNKHSLNNFKLQLLGYIK